MAKKFGFSFSWRRALGLSSAKGKVSRAIGIPLTKSGRQQKAGRMLGDLVETTLIAVTQLPQTSDSNAPSQEAIAATQAAVQGLRNQISSGEGFSTESLMGKMLIQRGGHRCQSCGLVYGAANKHCGRCRALLTS